MSIRRFIFQFKKYLGNKKILRDINIRDMSYFQN